MSEQMDTPRPRVRRRAGWTLARRQRFLAWLEETGNIAEAARRVKKSVSGLYKLRGRDPEFRRAWDEALRHALDAVEAVVIDRVLNGVEKPVFRGGVQVGSMRHYSDPFRT